MTQYSRSGSEIIVTSQYAASAYTFRDCGIRKIYAPTIPYEDEVARRWWALPLNCLLPLTDGGRYQLLFPGRAGGSAGPDVRDAVLAIPAEGATGAPVGSPPRDLPVGHKLVGDIEFHVRSSDWRIHRHDSDPRYNAVMLHVVLICDDRQPTMRQDGTPVPVCSLYDLPRYTHPEQFLPSQQSLLPILPEPEASWPCQRLVSTLSADARAKLLLRAGLLRFEQKVHTFIEQLHATRAEDAHDTYNAYDIYDACLIPALAEGLGYGRDREFFRAVGLRLLQKHASLAPLPEPLGHTAQPAPLDANRLRILAQLLKCWRIPGVWQTLRARLLASTLSTPNSAETTNPTPAILGALRHAFTANGLSLARTDILIVNIVLPFAAAVALLEQHTVLAERAHQLYLHHPGLPSNHVTRTMSKQLQLHKEPQGSCRQQGLHYIYQQTCREKRCSICMMSKHDV
ncbi:MAG: hypothetical protein PVSMB5_08150 [Ktedonobacteraceae bacterium]